MRKLCLNFATIALIEHMSSIYTIKIVYLVYLALKSSWSTKNSGPLNTTNPISSYPFSVHSDIGISNGIYQARQLNIQNVELIR